MVEYICIRRYRSLSHPPACNLVLKCISAFWAMDFHRLSPELSHRPLSGASHRTEKSSGETNRKYITGPPIVYMLGPIREYVNFFKFHSNYRSTKSLSKLVRISDTIFVCLPCIMAELYGIC